VSKARRLIPSASVYDKLDALRAVVVDDIDARLMGITDSSQLEWDGLYKRLNGEVRRCVDDVLLEVAQDLGLSAQNKKASR